MARAVTVMKVMKVMKVVMKVMVVIVVMVVLVVEVVMVVKMREDGRSGGIQVVNNFEPRFFTRPVRKLTHWEAISLQSAGETETLRHKNPCPTDGRLVWWDLAAFHWICGSRTLRTWRCSPE